MTTWAMTASIIVSSAGAGLTYKLNRTVQIKGEFRPDWLQSNTAGADYTASIFMLGLRVQR